MKGRERKKMNEVTKNIARELKLLRIANDYTLKELSEKTSVNTATLCRYEQGKSDMKISTIYQIVNGYNIDTGFFLAKTFAKTREEE